MYAFFVQLYDLIARGRLHYFLIFFVIVWMRWLVVQKIALKYRPYTAAHRASTSVIIPVVNEEPSLFRQVLDSICAQQPTEVVVVINGPRNRALEAVCADYDLVRCYWTRTPGKRNALRIGLTKISGDVSVLVDSDTIWEADALAELIKPFADPKVGGVTTKQEILNADHSILTRFCNWTEEIRASGSFRAMSTRGTVGCLPGRTIAFRTSILRKVIDEFMTELFMGFHKEVSDDRSLTNLTLKAGYKTVYQATSVVKTEAPEEWKKFIRQQVRWAEGSQYNNLRMFGWMIRHARLMLFIYLTDTLIPFFLVGVYLTYIVGWMMGNEGINLFVSNPLQLVLLSIGGAWLSLGLRYLRRIADQPMDFFYLLPYLLILTFLMTPIRILGFAKLADDLGWGTRADAYQKKQPELKLPQMKTEELSRA
jgi:hyaluronan synthase